MGGVCLITVAIYASYAMWWAGLSWGPRFLVPVVPVMAILAVAVPAFGHGTTRRWRIAVWSLLFVIGAAVMVTGLLFNPNGYGAGLTLVWFFRPSAWPLVTVQSLHPPWDFWWLDLWSRRSPMITGTRCR